MLRLREQVEELVSPLRLDDANLFASSGDAVGERNDRSLVSLDFAAFDRDGFIIVVRCDTGRAFGLLQRLEEMDWAEIDVVNSHVLTLYC